MRHSQVFFCSGVAPTVMGSLPKNVASTEVAIPRSMRAISSQMQWTSNVPPPMPPNSSGMKSSWMPNLSGLHMSRTISIGHSSRSSRSIRTSSGRRFLANSLRDFKLSFSVFDASMDKSSLGGNAAQFTGFVGQFGQELEEVIHDSDVGHLKDRGLGVLVNGDEKRTSFNSSQMLERTADAAGQVNLGLHGFSRGANLAGLLHPLGVDHGARATDGSSEDLGQFLSEDDVLFFLD